MKKIIALVLSIALVCCCGLTVLAAESPVAEEKIEVIIRRADGEGYVDHPDIEYTVDANSVVTAKVLDTHEKEYGKFDNWSVYKVEESVEGVSAPVKSGVITLNAAINLAATTKVVPAVLGTDYDIISGSLESKEVSIKCYSSVIICANYNGTKTEPLVESNTDNSANAPQTGDIAVVYASIIMLAVVAFGFSVKKVYSK